MRNPTQATTSIMTSDSASRWSVMPGEKPPAGIQVQSVCSNARRLSEPESATEGGRVMKWTETATARTAAAPRRPRAEEGHGPAPRPAAEKRQRR